MHPCTLPRLSDPVQSPSGVILFDSVPGRSIGLHHKLANVILTFGNYEREFNSCSLGCGRLATQRQTWDHNSGDFNWPAKNKKILVGTLARPTIQLQTLVDFKVPSSRSVRCRFDKCPSNNLDWILKTTTFLFRQFVIAAPAFRTTWRPVLVQYLVVPWVPHRYYRRHWDRIEECPRPSFRRRDRLRLSRSELAR